MLDFDLAELYEIEKRVLNQAVKRNIDIFPDDFMFQLTQNEWENMLSQIVMTYQYKAINYLLQKENQETEQKERKRIGFKTGKD